MNKDQMILLGGHLYFKNEILLLSGMEVGNLSNIVINYCSGNYIAGTMSGVVFLGLGAYLGFLSLKNNLNKKGGNNIIPIIEIKENPKSFPFQYVEEVIIEDSFGLEGLLKRTSEREKREWGVPVRSELDGNKAMMTEIYEPYKDDYCLSKSIATLLLDFEKIRKDKFNGSHHFHPLEFLDSLNFSVGIADRIIPVQGINLLSFNYKNKPVVIGFNRLHTYLPLEGDQERLQKASFKEIYQFLA